MASSGMTCSLGLRCRPGAPAAFTSLRPRRASRVVAPVAALDPQAALAVTQQGVAFAAVVGAEAAFTGLNTPATNKGRPSVVSTVAGVGGVLAGVALLQSPLDTVGYGLGFAASAFLFAIYLQRVRDTEHIPEDWPGPKAWPAVMALISFFSLMAFLQALLPAVGLK